MKWSGHYTALITPFVDQKIDEEGFSFLLRRQIEAGIQGVVLLGTTGEGLLLSEKEKETLFRLALKEKGEICLIAATGGISTQETIEKTKKMADLGAEAALIVCPPYIKPTQEGLKHHFTQIAKAAPIPLIFYNNPPRTVVGLEPETIAHIASLPQFVAMKESSTNLVHLSKTLSLVKRERPDFTILCGDDEWIYSMMQLGAQGAITSAGNLAPRLFQDLVEKCLEGQKEEALALHQWLLPLFQTLSVETNPIPLKAALSHYGLPSGQPRLPLTPLSPRHYHLLEQNLHFFESFIKEGAFS